MKEEGITCLDIKEKTKDRKSYLQEVKEEALIKLGYFLKPSELFSEIAKRGNSETVWHGRDGIPSVSTTPDTDDTVIHSDETGFYYESRRNWLHVAATEYLTYYYAHQKRGKAAMDEMEGRQSSKG